jgi:hypothetical protein
VPPMLHSHDDDTLAFYSREASAYASLRHAKRNARLDEFLGRLRPDATVLELGRGGGQDAEVMLSAFGWTARRMSAPATISAFGRGRELAFGGWDIRRMGDCFRIRPLRCARFVNGLYNVDGKFKLLWLKYLKSIHFTNRHISCCNC